MARAVAGDEAAIDRRLFLPALRDYLQHHNAGVEESDMAGFGKIVEVSDDFGDDFHPSLSLVKSNVFLVTQGYTRIITRYKNRPLDGAWEVVRNIYAEVTAWKQRVILCGDYILLSCIVLIV
ncbi:hypothetical protein Droror1_Dr00004314 [Drosera rotundifolia]